MSGVSEYVNFDAFIGFCTFLGLRFPKSVQVKKGIPSEITSNRRGHYSGRTQAIESPRKRWGSPVVCASVLRMSILWMKDISIFSKTENTFKQIAREGVFHGGVRRVIQWKLSPKPLNCIM